MIAFNVKVIQYPNGEVQVRRYSTPIERKEQNSYEKDMTFLYESELDFDMNPFTGIRPKEVESIDDLAKIQEDNARRSFNRTIQRIYEYSRCVCWDKFITITFNPEKVNRYDYHECSKIVRQWLHNQRRNAPDLQYLLVPELHQDGAIHFHGLLSNIGKMKFKDSGKRTKDKQPIYNMSAWSNGFTTATDVTNTHSVAKYIGKYITKELCSTTSGQQRYFVSQNLPIPDISTFIVDTDDDFNNLLETLNNSLSTETVHVSKPRRKNAFVDVDYYELQERNANDITTSI